MNDFAVVRAAEYGGRLQRRRPIVDVVVADLAVMKVPVVAAAAVEGCLKVGETRS